MAIEICLQLTKGEFKLDVDMALPDMGITVLFGPSGSGKTTVLNAIAGLEKAKGNIVFKLPVYEKNHQEAMIWQNSLTYLPAHHRPVGYVFQQGGLFPHLNVLENLRFGARRSGLKENKLKEVAGQLDLVPLLSRSTQHLSGGETQRVAIGRALLSNPRLLLFDEPLASLDQSRKEEILPYLQLLSRENKVPIIYVTHSFDELLTLADYLVVLSEGRALSQGPLSQVLSDTRLPLCHMEEAAVVVQVKIEEHYPEDHLSRTSLGENSLWVPLLINRGLQGDAKENGDKGTTDKGTGTANKGTLTSSDTVSSHGLFSEKLAIKIKAKDLSICLSRAQDSSILNVLKGTISAISEPSQRGQVLVKVEVGDQFMLARISSLSHRKLALNVGQQVYLQLKAVSIL